MAEPDLSPLGRPGNGYLGSGELREGAEAVVCRDCGALLPPHDTEARRLHEDWDRLVKAVMKMQVEDGASWH